MTTTPFGGMPAWLMDSDPAIRWQFLAYMTNAGLGDVAAERAKVATEGWGAQVLAQQNDDGNWTTGPFNQERNSTMHALTLLSLLGLDPASPEAQQAVARVRDNVTWHEAAPEEVWHHRYFEGETEPCINGQVAAAGIYFGQDVSVIIERLLSEQLADGGWNCDAPESQRSSFHSTICVLDALAQLELTGRATSETTAARQRAEEYILERQFFKRLSTGEVITRVRRDGMPFTQFAFPNWWHYDVLRGLEYFVNIDAPYDPRMADALALVESKRQPGDVWLLEAQLPGEMLVDLGERVGEPSRWITLRALRVLNAYAGA